MRRLWKTEEYLTLCCQRGSLIFIFLVASVSGPGNYLVMDTGSVYNKSQELLHFTLEEKGQTDLWGD